MRFLDSNILAYAFYDNEHTEKCQQEIAQGGVTDTFSLVEAFFIIEKETKNREKAQRCIRGLLKSNLQIIDVDINILFESLKKIGMYHLSIFDMIHYTVARLANCEEIMSYDLDFNKLEIPRVEPD